MCSLSKKYKKNDNDNDDESEKEYNIKDWTKTDTKKVGSKIPDFISASHLTEQDQQRLAECKNPIDYYKLLNPDSYLNTIIHESKIYAVQVNHEKALSDITVKNLRLKIYILQIIHIFLPI